VALSSPYFPISYSFVKEGEKKFGLPDAIVDDVS
jgi:hypothetical protein